MKLSNTQEKMMSALAETELIDCHEHLPPEHERTSVPQDVFTLFSHYTRHDLFSAGMDRHSCRNLNAFGTARPEYDRLFDYSVPLEERWQTFRPYWEAIRHGSYARAARITARTVYGVPDIGDDTYQILSERIAEENTPGIYKRMLCDRCHIRVALTQCSRTDVELPLVPLMPLGMLTDVRSREQIEGLADSVQNEMPRSLDEYIALGQAILDKWIADGTVGLKMRSQHFPRPNRPLATRAFQRLLEGREFLGGEEEYVALNSLLVHEFIDIAAEAELVIAVHAGIWGDFRRIDSKFMLELAPAHPRATFDLYHLGMPSVRDTIVVAKNLPNVYLNLCWTHIISQIQTRSGIDEMLDQVPINKILAFGGDYNRPVEKVVGHLVMAKENLAHVFASRVDRGLMSVNEAKDILRRWFWDNPLTLYTRLEMNPD